MAWLVCDARVLASAEVADTRRARRRGLIGRDSMEGALVIAPCRWIHTIGMKFPIDVAYLDPDGVVVKTIQMQRSAWAFRSGVPGRSSRPRPVRSAAGASAWATRSKSASAMRTPHEPSSPPATWQHPMSTFWLVATPIGNLGDLAPRAVEVLSHAALVCCEDTRRTGLLLQHAGIRAARLAVCNDHTEMSRIADVLRTLGDGRDVAIVSDAGTPGISDPGERIVRAAIDAGYTVSAVPGPSAAIMALTISGLAADRFVFEGFIPRKGADRPTDSPRSPPNTAPSWSTRPPIGCCARSTTCATRAATTVSWWSPANSPNSTRKSCAARSATSTSALREASTCWSSRARAVDDRPVSDDDVRDALRSELDAGASTRDASATVAKMVGRPKREVYALAIALDRQTGTMGELDE